LAWRRKESASSTLAASATNLGFFIYLSSDTPPHTRDGLRRFLFETKKTQYMSEKEISDVEVIDEKKRIRMHNNQELWPLSIDPQTWILVPKHKLNAETAEKYREKLAESRKLALKHQYF
jgi:hypothetical protein